MVERARVSLDLGDLHQPSGILPVFSRGASLIHADPWQRPGRSEEHTSELQSLMRISYAVFCWKKKNNIRYNTRNSIKYKHQYYTRYTSKTSSKLEYCQI